MRLQPRPGRQRRLGIALQANDAGPVTLAGIKIMEIKRHGFDTTRAHVLHDLAHQDLLDAIRVRPLVLPDRFIDHHKPERMYDQAELNAAHIVRTVLAALGREEEASRPARA